MEMHRSPFLLRPLTLAMVGTLMASQPLRAGESLFAEAEQSCDSASDHNGPQCTEAPLILSATQHSSHPAKKAGTEKKASTSKSTAVVQSAANVRTQLDWVPESALTEAQRQALHQAEPWCTGTYIEPTRPGMNFRGDPDSAPIIAEADESSYESTIATLSGAVRIRQGYRQLESDKALLDRERNFGEFEGNIVFREPGSLIVGDEAESQLDTGYTKITKAQYVLHESHARGSASDITRNEDATLDLNDAIYTTCSPGDDGWALSGSRVTLDPATGYGTARNAVVRVQNVPVFYSPYLYFPIDDRRQSGFLTPGTIGYGNDRGAEIDLPYYWNIAPNYDATITPRIMTKRGFLLENEFRFLGEKGRGEIGASGLLGGDQQEKDNEYYKKDRWFVNTRYQRNFTDRWTAELDYADASDKDYLKDFGSDLNVSSSGPLNQRVTTRYDGGNDFTNWQLKLDAHKYKNMNRTSDDPYNKLPQIVLSGDWLATQRLNINYLADYTYFDRATDWNYVREQPRDGFPSGSGIMESVYNEGYGIQKAVGSRAYVETGVSYPMQSMWGFLKPSVNVRSVSYSLSNLNQDEVINDLNNSYLGQTFTKSDYTTSPTTTVPAFSVDSGLYFDRFTNLLGSDYTHTLEPRMKYLYAPYVDGQEFNPVFDTGAMSFNYSSLWQDNRFSGYDRLADANQLSLGITTRFIQDNGFERMRFGIGQTVYFKDRQVYIANNLGQANPNPDLPDEDLSAEDARLRRELQESTSPLASEFVYNFSRTMSLRQDVVWNTNENRLDNYALMYRYRPSNRKTFNMGFRYADHEDRFVKNRDGGYIEIGRDDDNNPIYQKTSNDLKASDISFSWPIPYTRHWSTLGRWQYDFTNKRNLEEMLGVEYASCCYHVRLFWRSYIESTDNMDYPKKRDGIYLQFILRGLGSLTGSSGKEYLQGITGYTIREK